MTWLIMLQRVYLYLWVESTTRYLLSIDYSYHYSGQTGAGKTYTIIGSIPENVNNVSNEKFMQILNVKYIYFSSVKSKRNIAKGFVDDHWITSIASFEWLMQAISLILWGV